MATVETDPVPGHHPHLLSSPVALPLTGKPGEVRKWITRMLERFPIALVFVSSVPQFHLRDTEGALHTAAEWAGRKAVLLYFVTVDCPVANSYVRERNPLCEAVEDSSASSGRRPRRATCGRYWTPC